VWKDKPVHVYTYDAETGTGLFLLTALQGGSRKMNWQIIREFRNGSHIDGTRYDAGEQIMDALMKDPYGLAISSLRYANPQVKVLKLARTQDSEYAAPTRESLIDGSYPLTRVTYAFLNRHPNASVAPLTAEFLHFIYSDEGRKLMEEQNGFLPLTPNDAADQLNLLR
jgi:phosphate transport system substrate-binding protein